MTFYTLTYHVVNDYVARREDFRQLHLAYATAALERGELLLGGAYSDPVDTALLIFQGKSREVAEEFAQADPYVLNGLVERWVVREWTVVIGQEQFDRR
jgi:uncharacterized protein YciI